MELDLDYLEERSGAWMKEGDGEGEGEEEEEEEVEEEKEEEEDEGDDEEEEETVSLPNSLPSPDDYSPPETSDLVKIILLGAPAVGKTSIIQQFVWNDYCEGYYPTDRRHTYYPSVVINGRLYDLKISDLPPVPYFPVDSLLEWTDFRSYGLRSATAYVLVFDLSNAADTFRHIKCLREQMAGSRDMRNVPVVVVGNKHDRLHEKVVNAANNHAPGPFFGVSCPAMQQSSSTANVTCAQSSHGVLDDPVPTHDCSVLLRQRHQQLVMQQNALAMAETRERREIANVVRKHWKWKYVECSAKYNWRVVEVFKELMRTVDFADVVAGSAKGGLGGDLGGCERNVPKVHLLTDREVMTGFNLHCHQRTPAVSDKFQEGLNKNRCDVL
ncbi:uncharacterized protein LOC124156085 [Ischnura elegans]|uniref:uncharacterized protein LOC124156085 n=1 Tax=Ischnura elegans TaxID=197161 RepID=UPI001ED8B3F0|nr:uncharacterized protein LOC124156085 [Ischnura elegans]